MAAHFIVETGTINAYKPRNHYTANVYTSAGRARGAMKRMGMDPSEWEVIDREEFERRDIMVETKNLMNGKKMMIRLSEKGTCTDPGTERYWSM